jgi:hypothetical protein
MNPYFVPLLLLVGMGILVEALFKPRLDFTHNHDVILWYYNKKRERVFVLLFHFH